MAWMASEPDSITPRVALARERTRLACMSCPNISSMWLRISSWLNMGIVCWVLAGQGWRSYLRSRATPRSYEGMTEVASKNQKAFMVDLKCVYKAATLSAAESALDELEAKWGEKYPVVIKSWRNKWEMLSAYFKYPEYVRTAIYTTNAVEAVHRQFRKLTKTKGGFANENSLLKLLYAGMLQASERWTLPIQNWNLTLSQLSIHFPGRLDDHIDL